MEFCTRLTGATSPFFFLALFTFFLSAFECKDIFPGKEAVRSYEGYQVFRVDARDERSYAALANMYFQDKFDFWSGPSRVTTTDILAAPGQIQLLQSIFALSGLNYTVMYTDLQKAIEQEKIIHANRQDNGPMNWNYYQRVDTIHGWMESMALQYPDLVYIENIGVSTEGRTLKVMKISTAGRDSNKSAIWLDGGIHAREWISPATVTFMANELIAQKQNTRVGNVSLIETFDWYIHPVMNPDGYEFTHTGDRMWRKTRSGPNCPIFGDFYRCCKGTDPNRNWNYQWGGKGTSKDQCTQTYHGPRPNSEPEVEHSQNFVMSRKDSIKLFLTFHSYSQLLLLPWSYDSVRIDDYDVMMDMGNKAMKALEEVHGTKYKGGATPDILYAASGGSHDWAKGAADIKFAYCYELRDEGNFGFLLPPNQIKPTGEETLAGVKSMTEYLIDYYEIETQTVEPSTEQNVDTTEQTVDPTTEQIRSI